MEILGHGYIGYVMRPVPCCIITLPGDDKLGKVAEVKNNVLSVTARINLF